MPIHTGMTVPPLPSMGPYLRMVSDKGGATVVADPALAEPEAIPHEVGETGRPGHPWRWVIATVAVTLAVVTALVGYVAVNETHINTQFDQAHGALDVTRSRVDITLVDLAAVRRQLGVVNSQVSATSAALAQDTAQLQGVQKALASAQVNVTDRTSTINDLHACLAGVEQALNALAVGDQTHAIDALNAVSSSCAGAVAIGG